MSFSFFHFPVSVGDEGQQTAARPLHHSTDGSQFQDFQLFGPSPPLVTIPTRPAVASALFRPAAPIGHQEPGQGFLLTRRVGVTTYFWYQVPVVGHSNPPASHQPATHQLNQVLCLSESPVVGPPNLAGITVAAKRGKMHLCNPERFGRSCRGADCVFSHTQAEAFFYRRKTGFCRTNGCQGGCSWAHSVAELAEHSHMKTQLCERFLSGFCPEVLCEYAHGSGELR